ncbi:MAG: tRNA (N6-threonylcarbamoyladenosine(37)-N6)-methyltransferase TrmO [Planctomycetes bacterium]|nr:tRNA (N6-threonylcarbamoyladenosine(37)-N6)-methyltransferase TrmO [Planctomycetota bacterium]
MAPATFVPIGAIRSEHRRAEETPIQPCFARGSSGRAEVLPAYEEGLEGIEGFSHVILIYHLHQAPPPSLTVRPFLDDEPRGVFATRHPGRPNPIGFSIVRLRRREGTTLFLEDVDVLDGTPLLDVKPFVPRFDSPEGASGGWVDRTDPESARRRGRRGWRGGEGGG